jgi:ribose transport system substrate-binding protein
MASRQAPIIRNELTGHADHQLSRRQLLSTSTALAVAAYLGSSSSIAANDFRFAASLGWTTYESGRHIVNGYNEAVTKLGGTLRLADASFDPKKQSDQIDALVSSKPDALFITPFDAIAIAPAVKRATDANIPVFVGDSIVPGALVKTTVMWNDYGMGAYMAEYIAQRIGGKGNIAAVVLPENQFWNARTLGMQSVLGRYPDIKLVATFPFSASAAITPRQAVDTLLTANQDLQAIWCAWDGAATEGALAVKAASREGIILTGIGGGRQPFEYIKSGSPMVLTMAQAIYEMSYLQVFFAHQLLAGDKVPPIIIAPTYAVTKEVLANSPIPDDYDQPGMAAKLGWKRVL